MEDLGRTCDNEKLLSKRLRPTPENMQDSFHILMQQGQMIVIEIEDKQSEWHICYFSSSDSAFS